MWGQLSPSRQTAELAALADRLDSLAGLATKGRLANRIAAAVDALERAGADSGRRSRRRHSTSGMPTREPLLERMQQDVRGVLGVIRFLDFDRLCAFDPSLGDQLLHGVATRLRTMLPTGRLLAHIDRGHLAIWFGPEVTEPSALSEMEAIEYALGEALQIGERTILPKTSSQIVAISGDDPATALARVLAQLSMATSSPTPGVAASGHVEREEFALEQDLRQALGRGELYLCYQPLIDAVNVRTFGAEALMRWQHPRRGAVSPATFVPVMEAIGLAHEFGMWALNTAVRDARRWHDQELDEVRVAVNVSGHQLQRDDLSKLLGRTLSRHGLAPSALEIELTETVAMIDCGRAARLFSDIRAMGVAIAIDDFGTGFSSLSTLRKLAFDKIKIDREFVTEVDRRKDSQAICQSIIALARGLGIRVLAEGVERPEEYGWLRQHGCNFFQGFYFSPPLDAANFLAFAKNSEGLLPKLGVDARGLRRGLAERLSA